MVTPIKPSKFQVVRTLDNRLHFGQGLGDTMETLHLSIVNGSWVCDFTGTKEEANIRNLFGTTMLPTPYTAKANPDAVIARIQERNPTFIIAVKGEQ